MPDDCKVNDRFSFRKDLSYFSRTERNYTLNVLHYCSRMNKRSTKCEWLKVTKQNVTKQRETGKFSSAKALPWKQDHVWAFLYYNCSAVSLLLPAGLRLTLRYVNDRPKTTKRQKKQNAHQNYKFNYSDTIGTTPDSLYLLSEKISVNLSYIHIATICL